MGGAVKRTSILGRLFPHLPSDRELKARAAANKRSAVQGVSRGSYLLQVGRYLTKEDMDERRRLVLARRSSPSRGA